MCILPIRKRKSALVSPRGCVMRIWSCSMRIGQPLGGEFYNFSFFFRAFYHLKMSWNLG
ncbi:hypothetical protein MtrunA17_Chr3g0100431 [Medicago truncatula]|uniref:Uncharacterized protein n=1 Tax=Medicago truncatula TaxID=3880 RepID=A0A396ITE0_MEDTR|nr:hypothetical protein MtrunA17_Chr3g0100431 [Medicago truncatula]